VPIGEGYLRTAEEMYGEYKNNKDDKNDPSSD